LGCAIFLVAVTLHWPLLKDAQVIHYINFLMTMALRLPQYHRYEHARAYLIEGGMHVLRRGMLPAGVRLSLRVSLRGDGGDRVAV